MCKVFCKTFKVSSPDTACHVMSSFVVNVEMLLCQIPENFVSFCDIMLAPPKEKLFCLSTSILNSCGNNLKSRTSLNSYMTFLIVVKFSTDDQKMTSHPKRQNIYHQRYENSVATHINPILSYMNPNILFI